MNGVRLRHRLEHAGLRAFRFLVTRLPEAVAYGIGSGLGWLVGSVLRIRRKVVDRNLRRAFPDRDGRWRAVVARASYRHLGVETVAVLRLAGIGPHELIQRTSVPGLDVLESALEEGKGALILTGHLGNWEVGGAALAARGIPLCAVARKQGNPLVERDLLEVRERLGVQVIEEGDAVRRVVDELRGGRVVALVADQNVRRGGVFVEFFGVQASTARGPALFALRSGSPIFVGAMLRQEGSPGWYDMVLERLEVSRTGSREEDVERIARDYSRVLERIVREAPGQYFWQHKRWKTRPPDKGQGGRGRNCPRPGPV